MKLIILTVLLTTNLFAYDKPEPKFHLNDEVTFRTPTFYNKVCSGHGLITSFKIKDGTIEYNVTNINKRSILCPDTFEVNESDIFTILK